MAWSVLHDAALENALAAAARHFAVIPLSRTKLPAIRSPHRGERPPSRCLGQCGRPGHGVHDATTDPDRIRVLFAAAPWATGYGIACGLPPHHLVGLDLDVKHGLDGVAALDAIAAEHGFTVPETVTVLTPSGGRHLWLSGRPGAAVPNSVGRQGGPLAPGIDVRGAGGYLVGPGSVTTRGRYVLAPGAPGLPVAEVPATLLYLLTPAPLSTGRGAAAGRGADSRRQGLALAKFVAEAPVGERNARLFWAACRAYENGHGTQLAELLVDAASRAGLPEREARSTVDSAAQQVGATLEQVESLAVGGMAGTWANARPGAGSASEVDTAAPVSIRGLRQHPLPAFGPPAEYRDSARTEGSERPQGARPMATSWQLTIDCAHPARLARFWAEALDYRVEPPPSGFASWEEWARGLGVAADDVDEGASVVDPQGVGPRLYFQRVPEGKRVKNRLHLDVKVSGGRDTPVDERRSRIADAVARLTEAGASVIQEHHWRGVPDHVVMADPEGNEFCLV